MGDSGRSVGFTCKVMFSLYLASARHHISLGCLKPRSGEARRRYLPFLTVRKTRYSARSASIGSTEAARRAGM